MLRKRSFARHTKTCIKKNKNMVIHVSEEEVRTIRRAILMCANRLTVAVQSENRFNARLIDGTMSTLADVITGVHDDLEGKWFSARVSVPDDRTGMLTTKKCRRVSN